MQKRAYWDHIYNTRSSGEVSWTQAEPQPSLTLITLADISKSAPIIDIGGGESQLADRLLDLGYTDITVLDISVQSLERARIRLGNRAKDVRWIVTDVLDFKPSRHYEVWHDRAAFHFLVEPEEVATYRKQVSEYVNNLLIIGTFSKKGPLKCSGLPIIQYDPESMNEVFKADFRLEGVQPAGHTTPFGTVQDFIFCTFQRK